MTRRMNSTISSQKRDRKYLVVKRLKDTSECRTCLRPAPDNLPSSAAREEAPVLHRPPEDVLYTHQPEGINFAIMTVPESDRPAELEGLPRPRDDVRIDNIDLFKISRSPSRSPGACTPACILQDRDRIAIAPTPIFVSRVHAGVRIQLTATTTRADHPSSTSITTPAAENPRPETAEVPAGTTRSNTERAPVGYRSRWRQGAHLHRLQEGLCATAALFLYGCSRIRYPPAFQQPLSLLDRGMSYAIAHIRGGRNGRKVARRRHAHEEEEYILRFIDCAEFLIKDVDLCQPSGDRRWQRVTQGAGNPAPRSPRRALRRTVCRCEHDDGRDASVDRGRILNGAP